jgi:hypothetical protein
MEDNETGSIGHGDSVIGDLRFVAVSVDLCPFLADGVLYYRIGDKTFTFVVWFSRVSVVACSVEFVEIGW